MKSIFVSMLELLTTDAFATWFSALPAGPAEDVAATLEVIVQLGTRTEAPASSEMLLWYEHPSLAWRPMASFLGVEARELPQLVKFTQDWGRFLGYAKRVIKHLESTAFVARLASLPPADAATVAEGVKRLRRLTTIRGLAMADFQTKRMLKHLHAPTPSSEGALTRLADVSEVREAYFAIVAAAGFELVDVSPHSPALREISLRRQAPGMRLLYGVDEPKNRGLVVVGEWLDRSFYGDTVRHAEAVWREFLEGRPLPTRTASAR